MEKLNDMLNKLKEHTEEVLCCYKDKEHWDDKDLKCAKEAAELYDILQTIQMNNGIWEGIKDESYGGDRYSGVRYPRISYGHRADGRMMDMDRSGMYYDDRMHSGYTDSHRMGRSMNSVSDQAIEKLEALMHSTTDEGKRREIMKMIEAIERQSV